MSCDSDEATESSQNEKNVLPFEQAEVGGQVFYFVPKELIQYLPSSGVEVQILDEVGPVEIGDNYMYIHVALFEKIRKLLSSSIDLQQEVGLLKDLLWDRYGSGDTQPPFDPRLLKKLCNDAGASKLFNAILYAMSTNDQVAGRMHLNEKKAVTIIYMLVFGQSQKANWFQKTLSRQVVTKGISESGLALLNKIGVGISKSTQKRDFTQMSKNHDILVSQFISEACASKDLLVLMIDDYTNIHAKRRPNDEMTSTARSMATILLKRFRGIPAIPASAVDIDPQGINSEALAQAVAENLSQLSATYASVMPYWIRSSFFDPEMERNRIEVK